MQRITDETESRLFSENEETIDHIFYCCFGTMKIKQVLWTQEDLKKDLLLNKILS